MFQYTFDDGEEYIRRVLVTETHITMVATVKVPGFSYDRIGLVQCTHDGQLDTGFGQDGAIIHTIDATTDLSVRDGAAAGHGGIARGGYHYIMSDNTEYPFIALFDASGQPQVDFGAGGIVIADTQPGEYFAMAATGDVLYLAGRTGGMPDDFMMSMPSSADGRPTPFCRRSATSNWNNDLTDLILDLVIDEEGRLLASRHLRYPRLLWRPRLRTAPPPARRHARPPLWNRAASPPPHLAPPSTTPMAWSSRPENKAVLVGHERPDQQRLRHRPLLPRARHQ